MFSILGAWQFERLTNATEKFADGNILTKKDILLSIGQNPVLYEGKLQITPNEWLEPVRNNAKSLRDRLDKARTLPEQMKKASEEAICLEWQERVDDYITQLFRAYKDKQYAVNKLAATIA